MKSNLPTSETFVVNVQPGRKAQISDVPYNKNQAPPYYMIGSGMSNQSYSSVDLIKVITELPKSVQDVFILIRDSYKYTTGLSEVDTKTMNKTAANKFYAGTKKLADIGLVLRIHPGIYLIHPLALVPSSLEKRIEMLQLWLDNNGTLDQGVINTFSLVEKQP